MNLVTHEVGPFSRDKDGTVVYLAKFILGATADETVIYLNGDPLDNRRQNLKVVTNAEAEALRNSDS